MDIKEALALTEMRKLMNIEADKPTKLANYQIKKILRRATQRMACIHNARIIRHLIPVLWLPIKLIIDILESDTPPLNKRQEISSLLVLQALFLSTPPMEIDVLYTTENDVDKAIISKLKISITPALTILLQIPDPVEQLKQIYNEILDTSDFKRIPANSTQELFKKSGLLRNLVFELHVFLLNAIQRLKLGYAYIVKFGIEIEAEKMIIICKEITSPNKSYFKDSNNKISQIFQTIENHKEITSENVSDFLNKRKPNQIIEATTINSDNPLSDHQKGRETATIRIDKFTEISNDLNTIIKQIDTQNPNITEFWLNQWAGFTHEALKFEDTYKLYLASDEDNQLMYWHNLIANKII